jgi:hypothetical protein
LMASSTAVALARNSSISSLPKPKRFCWQHEECIVSFDKNLTHHACPYLHINHRVDVHSKLYRFTAAIGAKVITGLIIQIRTFESEPFLFLSIHS